MIMFPNFVFIDDSSINFTRVQNSIRSNMEVGLPKTKKNQSIPSFILSFSASIHLDNSKNFFLWFDKDINSGNDFFLLRNPLTGVVEKFRFLNTEISWRKNGKILTSEFILEGYNGI